MCLDKQLDCLHSLQYALQLYVLQYAFVAILSDPFKKKSVFKLVQNLVYALKYNQLFLLYKIL